MWDGSAASARYAVGTVSGTSISFASPQTLTDNAGGVPISFGLTYDSTAGKIIFVYRSTDSNNRGGAKILTVGGSNSGKFVGITNQAINDTASGKVVVEGGVITNGSLGLTLTPGTTYYVQNDGSLGTGSTSVTAGKALAATTLLLKG